MERMDSNWTKKRIGKIEIWGETPSSDSRDDSKGGDPTPSMI